ncbi:MAG: S41 family peptidase [FCB group bacterium]|nr:S41 family peptidase [FCB group bacterium]
MKKTNQSRKWLYSGLLLLLVALFSFGAGKSELLRKIARSQKRFNDVYKYLLLNYVDEINIDTFASESIHELVEKMDPYTVFMEDDEQEGLKLLTNGSYGGVGIQIGKQNDELTVIAPMENSPALRAGILSGDVITKIDSLDATDISLHKASSLIRGPKGSNVTLTIQRYGLDHEIDFVLRRENIKVKDVAYADTIAPGVGYIRLTRFSRNAPTEMETAFKSLLAQNVNSIILDLRDNPGGLLNSAIDILDMIIPKGETLLSTRGRTSSSNRNFKSENNPLVPETVKIAVLINGGSASASEIVAGAIQDLDRGVIIGQSSFGKGLVQSVLDVDSKSALKITTAKYYIPSGRLIQKPGYVDPELIIPPDAMDSLYYTNHGRPVKGGGGIHPDQKVEGRTLPILTQTAWRTGLFFDYVLEHRDQYTSLDEVLNDSTLYRSFRDYLLAANPDIRLSGESELEDGFDKLLEDKTLSDELSGVRGVVEKAIQSREAALYEEEETFLKEGLIQEFARQMEGTRGRIHVGLAYDPAVSKAIETLENGTVYETFLALKN